MKNGDLPATKKDLEDLRETTKNDLENLKAELREAIHDSETRLLTAFHAFAESNAKRLIEFDRTDGSFRERFITLEERVRKIEKRLDLPTSSDG